MKMKRTVAVVAVIVLTVGFAVAHGNEQHVMGTVKAMADNSITFQTAKETVTVYTMTETKFVKSGVAASMKGPQGRGPRRYPCREDGRQTHGE
jgi:ammonia channel protein AmtB